jgi:GLPGLI family protein
MKIKHCIFIGAAILVCQSLYAQIPQPARPRDFSRREAIDSVTYQIAYSSRIRRVLHTESYSSDLQILDIGRTYSRYYSRFAEISDSISTNFHKGVNFGRDENGYFREGTYEDIYINYPKQGKISVVNRYLERNFIYEEDRPNLKWTISSEKENILGYECVKASTHFRGRTWYAWFTIDIPLNYGPWKLSGLPGLILKAEDADKYFTYNAVSIRQNVGRPIMMFTEKAQKCSRSDILEFNDLRWKDDELLINLMTGQEVITADPDRIGKYMRKDTPSQVVIPQKELE